MSSFNFFRVSGTVDLWEAGAGSATTSLSGNYWNALCLHYTEGAVQPLPSETTVTSIEPESETTSKVTFSDYAVISYDNAVLEFIQALVATAQGGGGGGGASWQEHFVETIMGPVTEGEASAAADQMVRDLSVTSNVLNKGQGPVVQYPLQRACAQLREQATQQSLT